MSISVKTVLVLGAGASAPYGMPTGAQLLDRTLFIIRHLSSYTNQAQKYPLEACEKFGAELSSSGFESVDAFLEWRPKWAELGKLAMAAALLESEKQAKLALFPRANARRPIDGWLQSLWNKIQAPTWSAFSRQPIQIVTFNYDRLVEHYLYSIAKTRFDVKPHVFLRWLPIVHVHGSLGDYKPHGKRSNHDADVASGAIKIVHEAGDDEPQVRQARRFISEADRVLFLGFGYNETNLKRIGFTPQTNERRRPSRLGGAPKQFVHGTHKGLIRHDWVHICDKYSFWENASKSPGAKCSEFLRQWL